MFRLRRIRSSADRLSRIASADGTIPVLRRAASDPKVLTGDDTVVVVLGLNHREVSCLECPAESVPAVADALALLPLGKAEVELLFLVDTSKGYAPRQTGWVEIRCLIQERRTVSEYRE